MTTLFVSDLHLDPVRPHIVAGFREFLREQAAHADALYILGDLFEYWVGDDDPQPAASEVADGLSALAATGVPIFFLRGNRDFLLRDVYATRCGMRILPDPCVIDLYGQPVLLLHGDTLCSDDVAYQAFRAQSREPAWQEAMLAQPLPARIALAQQARMQSIEHQRAVRPDATAQAAGREDITDVSTATVAATFARYGVATMIHGHTHRPAMHTLDVAGQPRRRVVLGDWYEHGSVLRADTDGFSLTAL
ncbi:MAG: UDP-2,3-diacylglucosamine diphosphatase [Proteobacteria bacterium]|nr:UDP-2,3-diacylglucosamine diphosphatase [Pseudomonadota bacterium]MBS0462791.1 UDP-2,3-diacylglucosamine diphosphatase [Pseudomonadota bacterium]MBS0463453.1 UDP-2,3-diacylglucosamine diphosphatase [Pseudomonadota bacterium]